MIAVVTLAGSLGLAVAGTAAQFSSGVQLVEVYTSVAGARGEAVTGLTRDDFAIYEDGVEQDISVFGTGEVPLTVALGVDRSWSMAGDRLRLSKLAAQVFLDALKPEDRVMVVAVNSEATVIAPLSTDRVAQRGAIAALDPWSTTALGDAIITMLDRLEPEAGRQALIVFSDGADRYSRATPAQVVERARRSRALVYPIVLGRERTPLLENVAAITGGRSFLLRDAKALEPTLAAIARELRDQYLLGYAPRRPIVPGSEEWRSIRVVLKGATAGRRLRARDGYATEYTR